MIKRIYRNHRLLSWFFVGSLLIANLLCLKSISASPAGLTVSPANIEFSIIDQAVVTGAELTLTNNYTSTIDLQLSIQNIETNNELGLSYSQDISGALSVEPAVLNLLPNQSQQINISFNDVSKLSPGGNYAVLVLKQTATKDEAVSINSELRVSIFVIKEQGAIRQLTASDIRLERWLFNQPHNVVITLGNSGNVQLVPRGLVLIGNPQMSIINQRAVINQESLSVLPGQELKLNIDLTRQNKVWFPQKQNLSLEYRYDGTDTIQTLNIQLWIVPTEFIGFVVLLIIILIVGFWLKKRPRTIRTITTNKTRPTRVLISDIKQPPL